MAAATDNITETGYEDKVVDSDLKVYDGTADTDESFGSIRTRIRKSGTTITATTDISIRTDTATGLDQINELCEDIAAHFARVKARAAEFAE